MQNYVIMPSPPPDHEVSAVYTLHDMRMLKEIFGDLPIASIELRPSALRPSTMVTVRLSSGQWFSFDVCFNEYYANSAATHSGTAIPLRYLASKVFEEYYKLFPKMQPVKDVALHGAALPPAEDLLIDP